MVEFSVNGTDHRYEGDSSMPLLWYLRDTINLTGTKYGCGAALCGACTVHIDGQAMRACVVSMAALAGKQVLTIEGLSEKGDHRVQRAWVEHQVPQCGFCQSGQIMQAAALLAENANPSDQEIDDAMQGVICRCGTYTRIRAAIKTAAGERT